ncbi:MAG: efflux RND transporter periplasmic adaptor subunit [Pseudomonadota bacterium]
MSIRSYAKFVGLAAFALLLAGCGQEDAAQGGGEQQQPPAAQVGFVTLKAQTVGLTGEMPGRTVAFRMADIRPQVDGIVKERSFTEGTLVEAGQQLYLINQDVYLAEVDAAEAELARQRASLDRAAKNRVRYEQLVKTQAASTQSYDDAVADEAEGKALVAAARASLDKARINLEYTSVVAPISGRIGSSRITEGALVTASQADALATITQLDPIYVDVTQAGGKLLQIRDAIAAGRLKGFDDGEIEVRLTIDSTGGEYGHVGKLQFSEVTVNETTGTVRLRAVFPNPDGTLLPGMFVRASVDQGRLENAFLVPQRSVMRRPDGSAYVYAIADDNTIVSKDVTIEQSQKDAWVVSAGLEDGDRVAVDGVLMIGPGAPVTPVSMDDANAQQAAAQ